MTQPNDPGATIDVGGEPVQVFPSVMIMVDAAGTVTDDPAVAVSGEIVETMPDGSKIFTTFNTRSE